MGEMEFVEADGHNTLSELGYMFYNLEPGAIIIAILSLFILLLWERPFIKQNDTFKLLPAPLIVVFLGIALNEVYSSFLPQLYLDNTHLVTIPVSNSLGEFISFFTLPDFSQWNNVQVYEIAFTLAIIASIETLLVVEATDKLDPEKRVTPTNLELKAQGIGNFVTGLIGGLPITQVIVRSAANVEAGGKTRLSAFLHGIFLLLSAMLIPSLLNKIPLSALAAILIVVGYKLTRISLYQEMYNRGRWQFIPFIVTVGALVFTDMLTGVILGLAVGAFHILLYNYKVDYLLEKGADNQYTIHLSEYMSFLNKAGVMNVLRDIPANSKVIVDASRTEIIDADVREVITNFAERAKAENIKINWRGLEGKDL
jgi:MFS superfamily sulfate permease-like transporter